MNLELSDEAKLIIEKLNINGYECFAVGGCVRDLIMGNSPHDYDFTTNALPEEIKRCFTDYKIYDVGQKFGTICVLINNQKYEITTYRSDGIYMDNRHPSDVNFSNNIHDDLSRRDLTINAIAYNDKNGIIDDFSSLLDLKNGIIRCVGNPVERFNEDALRILRALRFAARFEFKIDVETEKAIHNCKHLLNNVAVERISEELLGILCSKGIEDILSNYRDVFAQIIPEIEIMFDFEQYSPHHCYDVWKHTIKTIVNIENDKELRMAMLLHDIGKPYTRTISENGRAHFYGHPEVSADKSKPILKRLKYSNDFINDVTYLIRYHDVRFNGNKKTIKKVMRVIGSNLVEKLFRIQCADILGQSDYQREEKSSNIISSIISYQEIIKDDECYTLSDLKIDGNDLMNLGIPKGKCIGIILENCLSKVINEELENDREKLIKESIKQYESFDKMN